jgi:hypothetical protein
MTYEALEDSVVSRLIDRLGPGVVVKTAPGSEAEVIDAFDKPAVTVMYMSSEFSDSTKPGYPETLSLSVYAVDEFALVEIVCRARTRRNTTTERGTEIGILGLFDSVRRALVGWVPQGWEAVLPKKSEYLANVDGVHVFNHSFVACRIAVQDYPAENATPVLTQVNFTEQ